jgi:hypothetical protein
MVLLGLEYGVLALAAGLQTGYLWMLTVAVVAVALAMPVLDRRDIAAHA